MRFRVKFINYRIKRLYDKKKKINQKIENLKLKRFNIQTDIDISRISRLRSKYEK